MSFRFLKNRVFVVLFVMCAAAATPGCVPLVFVGAGAVVGYAVSRDSVTLDMDRPADKVWAACTEEVRRSGRIKREDRPNGRLEGQIQKADIVISMEPLTEATVRVVIRARKNLLPQLEVAQKLAVAIARRVG